MDLQTEKKDGSWEPSFEVICADFVTDINVDRKMYVVSMYRGNIQGKIVLSLLQFLTLFQAYTNLVPTLY